MQFREHEDEKYLSQILEVYRQLINERYQYEALNNAGKLSKNIDRKIVNSIRGFFLNDVYPEADKRKKIEKSFETLSNYTKHPAKAFGLFGSVTSAIFIFGKHLPSAINAGIVTLQSFVDARHLEEKVIYAAKNNYKGQLLSLDDMKQCIKTIPKEDLEKFINDIREMFLLLSNSELLEKTIRIIEMVIEKMRSKPNLYPKHEVEGIILGKSILVSGFNIFNSYPDKLKKEISDTIYDVEMSFINELYSTY